MCEHGASKRRPQFTSAGRRSYVWAMGACLREPGQWKTKRKYAEAYFGLSSPATRIALTALDVWSGKGGSMLTGGRQNEEPRELRCEQNALPRKFAVGRRWPAHHQSG
eukprot:6490643-Amphidinium_carterae.1